MDGGAGEVVEQYFKTQHNGSQIPIVLNYCTMQYINYIQLDHNPLYAYSQLI
jgi:hypothetical protein